MDHYSIPEWNETLVRKIRMMGTESNAYMYARNSHEFEVIEGWSPEGSVVVEKLQSSTIEMFDNAPGSGFCVRLMSLDGRYLGQWRCSQPKQQ